MRVSELVIVPPGHGLSTVENDAVETCAVCGRVLGDIAVDQADVATRKFSARMYLADWTRPLVCLQCAWMFADQSQRSHHNLVQSDGALVHPMTRDLRHLLTDPPETPFVLAVSESRKKYTLPFARVALSREDFPVRYEDTDLLISRNEFVNILEKIEALLAAGASRTAVRTSRYTHTILRKVMKNLGEQAFIELMRGLEPLQGSRFLALAVTVADSAHGAGANGDD